MKKLFLACLVCALFSSCSLLQRSDSGDEYEVKDIEPGQSAVGASSATEPEPAAPVMDSELSKLHTKISALETKVDVLSANLERVQAQRNQPVIRAEMPRQKNMATSMPGDEANEEVSEESSPKSAPGKPVALPSPLKEKGGENNTEVEKDFRAAMKLFQGGRNLEAASQFALISKKYPDHLLAGHALYWAGEASSRGQQISLAIENWSELEKKYPHSAYLPEALAGLAKAYENQGDKLKAKKYRANLTKSFPKSPVAMRSDVSEQGFSQEPIESVRKPEAPSGEDAPVFSGEEPNQGDHGAED